MMMTMIQTLIVHYINANVTTCAMMIMTMIMIVFVNNITILQTNYEHFKLLFDPDTVLSKITSHEVIPFRMPTNQCSPLYSRNIIYIHMYVCAYRFLEHMKHILNKKTMRFYAKKKSEDEHECV